MEISDYKDSHTGHCSHENQEMHEIKIKAQRRKNPTVSALVLFVFLSVSVLFWVFLMGLVRA